MSFHVTVIRTKISDSRHDCTHIVTHWCTRFCGEGRSHRDSAQLRGGLASCQTCPACRQAPWQSTIASWGRIILGERLVLTMKTALTLSNVNTSRGCMRPSARTCEPIFFRGTSHGLRFGTG